MNECNSAKSWVSKKYSKFACLTLLGILGICIAPMSSVAQHSNKKPQCSDGIDNEPGGGDGEIDYLQMKNPDYSQSFTYTSAWNITYDMNQILGSTVFPSYSGAFFDAKTAQQICFLKGYARAGAKTDHAYTSCGDNAVVMYNTATQKFELQPACGRNRIIYTLTCEGPLPDCRDGKDNDGDGLKDFPEDKGCAGPNDISEIPHDPGCSSLQDNTENTEDRACSDGKDNDADGFADFPEDKGCSSPDDTSERDPNGPACDNGIDDDGDGLVDVAYDPDCDSREDNSEATPQCRDGIDNDGNGFTDYPADQGCSSADDTTESGFSVGCSDGIDNDGDGLTDYPNDPGCDSPYDDSEKNPFGPQCDNGIDDDGNGYTDFPSDGECDDPFDNSEYTPQCRDGKDNDGNGFTDYPSDPGCTDSEDNMESGGYLPDCSDGQDNDGDGYIDYPQDPGCSSPADDYEKDPSAPACDNGIDDDNDGLADYPYDPDCQSPGDGDELGATPPVGPNCIETNHATMLLDLDNKAGQLKDNVRKLLRKLSSKKASKRNRRFARNASVDADKLFSAAWEGIWNYPHITQACSSMTAACSTSDLTTSIVTFQTSVNELSKMAAVATRRVRRDKGIKLTPKLRTASREATTDANAAVAGTLTLPVQSTTCQ